MQDDDPKRFLQALQSLVHDLFPIGLSQANLHGGGSGSFGGRRLKSFQAHHIEEQVFPHHEIQPHASRLRPRHGTNIRVIPGSIKRAEAVCDFFAIKRLAGFHADARGGFRQDMSVFAYNANGNHQWPSGSFVRGSLRCARCRLRLHGRWHRPREERKRDHPSHSVDAAQSHAFFRSDEA